MQMVSTAVKSHTTLWVHYTTLYLFSILVTACIAVWERYLKPINPLHYSPTFLLMVYVPVFIKQPILPLHTPPATPPTWGWSGADR